MATSCRTHDYDGQLRDKWFQMRPMLIDQHLPRCMSFEETLKDIERWLDEKYFNVKRIGRARRALRILATHRTSNLDRRNEIDVEELLPILWNQVRNQTDIHDTFYEQMCDITGGSCAQGRSTRLFQFLFLFDLPSEAVTAQADKTNQTNELGAADGITSSAVAQMQETDRTHASDAADEKTAPVTAEENSTSAPDEATTSTAARAEKTEQTDETDAADGMTSPAAVEENFVSAPEESKVSVEQSTEESKEPTASNANTDKNEK